MGVAVTKAMKAADDYEPALADDIGAQADLDGIRLTLGAIALQVATDTAGTGR